MKNILGLLPPKAGFLFVVFSIFTTTTPLHAQWIQTNGPYGGIVRSFAVSGTNLFAGTSGGGVFLSTNNGASWTAVSTGLTNTHVYALGVSGTNLFAGTYGGGVWRCPLSQMITSVKETISDETPNSYALQQNYPNPFNPITTINYQVPTQSHLTLKVFDVLGREVATLVNGVEEPGYKSVAFDASRLTSGVYFYRLRAGSYTETKKLILLR